LTIDGAVKQMREILKSGAVRGVEALSHGRIL